MAKTIFPDAIPTPTMINSHTILLHYQGLHGSLSYSLDTQSTSDASLEPTSMFSMSLSIYFGKQDAEIRCYDLAGSRRDKENHAKTQVRRAT
jgi:hypothetical protein